MNYANLAVHVDHSDRCHVGRELAFDLAEQCNAHLTGVYVDSVPLAPELLAMSAAPALMDELVREESARAQQARQRFDALADKRGIATSFRHGAGPRFAALATHARYCDLMIMTQDDEREPGGGALVNSVLLDCGRPLLVVPWVGATLPVGGTALVAWNGTREATRAVNDALPLLALANKVQVVVIDPQNTALDDSDLPGAELCEHLARHNLDAEAKVLRGAGGSSDEILLSHAADVSANLIVMGAWGHSRLREMILGGMTSHILRHMTVPVLMSH